MERRSFLRALGLIGAVSAIPSIVIDAAELIKPSQSLPKSTSEYLRPVRVYDMVIFNDGTEARVVSMNSSINIPTVDLLPVYCNIDLGNGAGMSKTYDKDTLPEIAQIIYSAVMGESSRNF